MNSRDYIRTFLQMSKPMDEISQRRSTLTLALKAARKLCGVDLVSGEYVSNELNEQNFLEETYFSFQFTGLINYLILLEQIGSIFKPKDSSFLPKKNGIYCSLKYFSSLNDDEINSIVALRNSLVHKFGLTSEKNPQKNPPRKFHLSIIRDSIVVKLPIYEWDGDFENKSEQNLTTIFLFDLIELIESVYKKTVKENENDNLEIILSDGLKELEARFTIIN